MRLLKGKKLKRGSQLEHLMKLRGMHTTEDGKNILTVGLLNEEHFKKALHIKS
jgi:hypothetical protein